MYYIIETQEQLEKFSQYDLSNSIVDVILFNDSFHPAISPVSLVYIKPFRSRAGFILPIDHTESFSLTKEAILALFEARISQIYAINAERLLYFIGSKKPLNCLKMAKFIATGEIVDESTCNTPAHNFYYQKYDCRSDINRIIPIAKHYEKLEKLVSTIGMKEQWFKPKYYKFLSHVALPAYQKIERSGIKIDRDILIKHYNLKCEEASLKDSIIYGAYNPYTATGRPSDAFNGVNFSAQKKDSGSRSAIIARNDMLVEFDYSSYHIKLLCDLIGYTFEDADIHTHLGKLYAQKDHLTEDEYAESKKLTFRFMYTENLPKEVEGILFFQKVKQYKHILWERYRTNGFIESHISKRPIKGIDSMTQILPYVLQSYETERNILIINELHILLEDKETKLVMYNYDSFLFDYSKKDGKKLLEDIQNILEQDGFNTSCSYGNNYQDLTKLILH
jgi:hypothetical protein